jgi:hypothetical protein
MRKIAEAVASLHRKGITHSHSGLESQGSCEADESRLPRVSFSDHMAASAGGVALPPPIPPTGATDYVGSELVRQAYHAPEKMDSVSLAEIFQGVISHGEDVWMSEGLEGFLKGMEDPNPDARPSVERLCQEEWLNRRKRQWEGRLPPPIASICTPLPEHENRPEQLGSGADLGPETEAAFPRAWFHGLRPLLRDFVSRPAPEEVRPEEPSEMDGFGDPLPVAGALDRDETKRLYSHSHPRHLPVRHRRTGLAAVCRPCISSCRCDLSCF